MLDQTIIKRLQNSTNLLAFSAGGDSSALFFLLVEHGIAFDIAIVDYGLRQKSKEEVAYAKELAKRYGKVCYVSVAPRFQSNFEARARAFRYSFFEKLIAKHGYSHLLTAHHLGDRLEWLLMQLCRGGGAIELAGMRAIEQREGYMLVRPLLDRTKEELQDYLKANNIPHFNDSSNEDLRFKRNQFRRYYAAPLLKEYASGIRQSFAYLDEDRTLLEGECRVVSKEGLVCFYAASSQRAMLYRVDLWLKSQNILLSSTQKKLLKQHRSIIAKRRYIVAHLGDLVCIAPLMEDQVKMPKRFKERCRRLKIEPKLRPYLYCHQEAFLLLEKLLKNET